MKLSLLVSTTLLLIISSASAGPVRLFKRGSGTGYAAMAADAQVKGLKAASAAPSTVPQAAPSASETPVAKASESPVASNDDESTDAESKDVASPADPMTMLAKVREELKKVTESFMTLSRSLTGNSTTSAVASGTNSTTAPSNTEAPANNSTAAKDSPSNDSTGAISTSSQSSTIPLPSASADPKATSSPADESASGAIIPVTIQANQIVIVPVVPQPNGQPMVVSVQPGPGVTGNVAIEEVDCDETGNILPPIDPAPVTPPNVPMNNPLPTGPVTPPNAPVNNPLPTGPVTPPNAPVINPRPTGPVTPPNAPVNNPRPTGPVTPPNAPVNNPRPTGPVGPARPAQPVSPRNRPSGIPAFIP